MKRIDHILPFQSPGNQRSLTSWHFGQAGARPRVYLQAGLHADELPGILVAQYLRQSLEQLEQAGLIKGEIVLVPVANPIGLSQFHQGQHHGRFEGVSGRNFNRGFPDLVAAAAAMLESQLSDNPESNQALVRQALRQALAAQSCASELDALQSTLFGLALDADVVLDLHCDSQAAMHVYAHSDQLESANALGAYLGACAILHASEQGGQSFDDACTRQWWQLRKQFSDHPIPFGCFAATVELRGQADVDAGLAQQDVANLIAFLTWAGAIAAQADHLSPPALRYPATPLVCVEVLVAPIAGVVVYHSEVGAMVHAGELVGELVDPLSGLSYPLRCSQDGMYYARVAHRYAQAGTELCFIAGQVPQRRTHLLAT